MKSNIFKKVKSMLKPEDWGLEINTSNQLLIGGCSTVDLAGQFGTPLHVVDEKRLEQTAKCFIEDVQDIYPGKVSIHFAFKCNPVPGIVQLLKQAGLRAEVMSQFELDLAHYLGYRGKEIIINGPYKPTGLLESCLKYEVRFIIVDSLNELDCLHQICEKRGCEARILLRINPDYIPRGMNLGSATGSRRGCAFGLDVKGGEVIVALKKIKKTHRLHFFGFHFHIGTGIADHNDYKHALQSLENTIRKTGKLGFSIPIFDIGGGLGTATSREMTTKEMLMYQAFGKLPSSVSTKTARSFKDFATAVSTGMNILFGRASVPELLLEPGRCLTSSSQLLLLEVHQVKERKGVRKWLVTNGGIGTVTMPTYYEFHEVFLCNDVYRPRKEKVSIIGPGCFASDIVYRNKRMPKVHPGEILAVMDSGAYFTSWESTFGFPRPAIVGAKDGIPRMIRHREKFKEMIARDQAIDLINKQ